MILTKSRDGRSRLRFSCAQRVSYSGKGRDKVRESGRRNVENGERERKKGKETDKEAERGRNSIAAGRA